MYEFCHFNLYCISAFILQLYLLHTHFHGVFTQWKTVNPFTQWNWDDEHKLGRVSGSLKSNTHYKLMRDITNRIREQIFNSTITMQKYRKMLKGLNQEMIKFGKDIDIRFNSILPLLDRTLKDYVLVLRFMDVLCAQSEDVRQFRQKWKLYQRQQQLYEELQRRQQAPAPAAARRAGTTEEHAAQLLQASRPAQTQTLQKPKAPTMPRAMDIRNALNDPRFLFVMALLYDYIDLMDQHAKRTGSVKWIKCMTEKELTDIERTLSRWKNQSETRPRSPVFTKVCSNMDMRGVL